MKRLAILLTLTLLAGCGVETASTAVTAGAAKTREAEQAQNTQERIQQQIDAASAQAAARLQAAEDATR
ncbi:MAG: hypothetical protein Kow0096_16890 [Thiohalomonadaceae bacterium]